MEGLWQMMSGWEPLGQGFFLLLVLGGIFALIRTLARYAVVMCQGWPPDGKEE